MNSELTDAIILYYPLTIWTKTAFLFLFLFLLFLPLKHSCRMVLDLDRRPGPPPHVVCRDQRSMYWYVPFWLAAEVPTEAATVRSTPPSPRLLAVVRP